MRSKVNAKVFTKLKVKVKDEIIKIGFCGIRSKYVSKNRNRLEPKEWDDIIGTVNLL